MSKHKIYLTELEAAHSDMDYLQLYSYILSEISSGHLIQVKAAGLNGKSPALPVAYWVNEPKKDYSNILSELKYKIHTSMDTSYYYKHPEKYCNDREYILKLSDYLTNCKDCLATDETINERSFEIFCREKFLDREGGIELLAHLGLSAEKLNFYRTSEPMSYYSHQKQTPQNFLIIENKDTFYSMRKYMIEGHDKILGLKVGTLIYGGGKGIYKSFDDFVNAVEPYFGDENNKIYYFGDLDYEGILIYETLVEKYKNISEICLFTNAYEKMLHKAEVIGTEKLPDTKDGQNRNIGRIFLEYFPLNIQKKIMKILEDGKYIPQEIVNEKDYSSENIG